MRVSSINLRNQQPDLKKFRLIQWKLKLLVEEENGKVPPLRIPEKMNGIDGQRNMNFNIRCDKMTQNEDAYEPPEAPRTVSCYSKNYELPTIASRMKQAAKYYLNTFNFKVSMAILLFIKIIKNIYT